MLHATCYSLNPIPTLFQYVAGTELLPPAALPGYFHSITAASQVLLKPLITFLLFAIFSSSSSVLRPPTLAGSCVKVWSCRSVTWCLSLLSSVWDSCLQEVTLIHRL